MTALIQGMQTDRSQRLIDWTIFGLGAASLTLALALTIAGALSGDTAVAAAAQQAAVRI